MTVLRDRADRKRVERGIQRFLRESVPLHYIEVGAMPSPARYPCRRLDVYIYICPELPANLDLSITSSLHCRSEPGMAVFPAYEPEDDAFLERVRPFLDLVDEKVEAACLGCDVRRYGPHANRPDVACMDLFPPNFPEGTTVEEILSEHPELAQYRGTIERDVRHDQDTHRNGRWMTDAEAEAFELEAGHPPFSDQAWIPTHYTGVNMYRRGEWGEER